MKNKYQFISDKAKHQEMIKQIKSINSYPSLESLEIELAKRSYLEYVKFVWQNRSSPLIVGKPTKAIANTIDWCLKRYRKGISSTVVINCPPRYGKSDLVSRYLPPRFLGEFPDREVLNVSHSFDKTTEFSRFARNLVQTKEFKKLYPNIEINPNNKNIKSWGILDSGLEVNGKSQSAGIKSGVAGCGADCLVIDDAHKSREEADSEKIREKIYNEFTDGLLTRLAPVHILFILCTRWHVDDLTGRILENHNIQVDKHIILPALDERYKSGTCFPERFSKKVIEKKRKQLGSYGFSSLYQQEPTIKGGNIFKIDNIIEVPDEPNMFKSTRFDRVWDLASSDNKGDWTVGIKGKLLIKNDFIYIYIDDMVRFQKTAPKRDKDIKRYATEESIRIGVEAYGPYKDTFENLKDTLNNIISIKKLNPPGSKEIKAQPLEAVMEFNRFYIKEASWNIPFKKEFREFPSSKHDDIVDATSLIYWINKQTHTNSYLNIQY